MIRRNDNVLINSYNPPIKGRVVDMYTVPLQNIYETELKRKYPEGVPMAEVVLENGKLQTFVQDVLTKA
jgi:hypothetical protein